MAAVADAVGGKVDVLLDGGVRRGSDVVKALAMGADAVMIGRAYLWGLAANGQAGVENVLDVLRGGIDSAMLGLGRASVAELERDDLVIPDGFLVALGTGAMRRTGGPAATKTTARKKSRATTSAKKKAAAKKPVRRR